MDELEALRRKRLAELQKQATAQAEEQASLEAQVAQLENMVKQIFTKEALSRYGNVKAAFPEKAIQVLVVIGQLMQQGKIKSIDDQQLKRLLTQLTPEKKEFKISKR